MKMVIHADKTPNINLWNLNLDLVVPNIYIQSIYIYRPNGDTDFFDTQVIKDALSFGPLVAFYPMAGD